MVASRPPRGAWTPGDYRGTIPQQGCIGASAGQGRVGTPPDHRASPPHSPLCGKHRRVTIPSPKSPEPLPQLRQAWPTPPELRTTPSPPPRAQLQPHPRDPRGQGCDKESSGKCPLQAPSALRSPSRAAPHDPPGHQVLAGGGEMGRGIRGGPHA